MPKFWPNLTNLAFPLIDAENTYEPILETEHRQNNVLSGLFFRAHRELSFDLSCSFVTSKMRLGGQNVRISLKLAVHHGGDELVPVTSFLPVLKLKLLWSVRY